MQYKLTKIAIPDYKPLAKRLWDCIGANDGDTYAEVDAKFFIKLRALNLPHDVEGKTFGAWMKFTDHEKPSRVSPLDPREMGLLISVFERITAN